MLWPLVTMNYGSQAVNSFSVTSRMLCCCPASAAAAATVAAAAAAAADNFYNVVAFGHNELWQPGRE